VRRLSQLTDELQRIGVGKPIQLTIERGGRRMDVEITPADIGQARL
jgi:2-alkenal reductase